MNRRSTLLAVAVLALAGPSLAAEPMRVELADPGAPAVLDVEIEWGSIRVRGDADADLVTIDARPERPDEVTGSPWTAGESGNRVTVRQAPLDTGSFRSAHLEIVTPLRSDLSLRVRRGGDVWVDNVRGLVEVTNLNGSVELAGLAGAAAVNASNGAIAAAFAEVDAARDMIFATLNGSVELCLPAGFAGRVHLTSAGDPIYSEFPIEREGPARRVAAGETAASQGSEVRGRIGGGGSLLRVSTLNGQIALLRCR